MPMRRFGPLVFGLALALLAAAAALNVIVDPYLLYQTGLFAPLIQTPREDKYQLLLDRPTPPDALVLGSSRAERINPAQVTALTGLSAFNAAVSRATPVDFLVWTRFMMDGLGHTPRLLIVSLDPEAFNPVRAWLTPAWLAQSPLARYATDITLSGSGDSLEDGLRRLFSWQQTLDSLRVLQLDLTGSRPERLARYDADGGYLLTDPARDAGETVPDTRYLIPLYQEYPALSQEALAQLEQFLALCREAGITLIMYFPPYHDDLLAELRAQTDFQARHDELLAEIERLSERYPFAFYDLVDAAGFGGNPDLFFNSDHMDVTNSALLLEHILAGADG